ncbi:MAG: DoxX family protein [Woeseiaceae bacterium]
MFSVLDSFKPGAHWLPRIGIASVFLFHGIGKLASVGGFAEMMGLPYPVAALVTFAELAGGIGIIVGGFTNDLTTRLAALAMAPVLLGAILLVHGGRWSFTPAEGYPMGGMEFQVVLLLTALYFLIVGNSTVSQSE